MSARVLFLTHPELDHLEYHIFDGLCRVLGDENVITYPLKKIYYGEVADDYILDTGDRGYTAPPEYILPRKLIHLDLDEIIATIDDFDFVISSPRTYARKALKVLRPHITQPLALLDGEDGDGILWNFVNEFKPDIYFKREYLRDNESMYLVLDIPIVPCPFAAVDNTAPKIDDTQKEYSVFSVHGNTHKMREEVTKLLLEMNIPKSYIWINADFYFSKFNPYTEEERERITRLGYYEYLKMIAKSKIGVSVRGWGRDTLRRFEIPLYETLLFTHDIGIETPHPFVDGKTCVMFKNDLSDLKEKLEYYLEDENERIRIARGGHKHLLKYHTTEKRARYLLETLEKCTRI